MIHPFIELAWELVMGSLDGTDIVNNLLQHWKCTLSLSTSFILTMHVDRKHPLRRQDEWRATMNLRH